MDDKVERMKLLVQFANSYSAFFKSDDISQELCRLEEYVEESVVKLEELQSLLAMKESESKEWLEKIVPTILQQHKATVEVFNNRLESLWQLTQYLKVSLDSLETQIVQAEQAFGVNSGLNSSFRNVLNYFRRPVEPAMMMNSLDSKFVPPEDIDVEKKFFS